MHDYDFYDDELDDAVENDDEFDDVFACPKCGNDIYDDSVQCPRCGWYILHNDHRPWSDKPAWKQRLALIVVLVLLLLFAWPAVMLVRILWR